MSSEPAPTHATQLRNHWWWRPGWNADRQFYTWHLTFNGQHDLHRLVTAYQEALSNVPGLDLVPLEWLHLTMQGVGFTDEVSAADARAIANAAAERLAELSPVELTFHLPVVRAEALALAPAPMEALVTIRDTVRHGISAVWGAEAIPETSNRFEPHLSLAYANTDAPATAAVDALTSVTAEPAQVTISEASLIVLRRTAHVYQWDTYGQAAFTSSAPA